MSGIGSFVCKELLAYLGAEVKKASKRMATKESSMEVVEQQSDPQPSEPQPSTSQPSEPQLSTSQTREPQPSTPQQSEPQQSTSQVEDDEKQEDMSLCMKRSKKQMSGQILKLLAHMAVGVKTMTEDIAVLGSKVDRIAETSSLHYKPNSGGDRKTEDIAYTCC